MITYSYSEYSPEDDNQFSIDRLMSILSEMIMKYDISLEEALKLLIEKGIPANLFLKEAGMNDLVEKYLDQIKELVNKILSENKISPNIQKLENEISSKKKDINDKKIDPGLLKKLNKSLDEKNQDALRRLKWESNLPKEVQKDIDFL
jgi:gas vesicle protein